jgi:glycosyltransferase involved in cell wall biosynthesis
LSGAVTTAVPARIAVLASFSGEGGVERMVMNLVREFARRDIAVDLLTIRAASAHFQGLPANVRWIPLDAGHALSSIPELVRYFRRDPPQALLVAKDRAARAALAARRISGVPVRVVVRLGTNLLTSMEGKSAIARWLRLAPMKFLYRDVDRVIAVSQGVADDARKVTGLPTSRIEVIRNPVITAALARQAAAPCPHPWLEGPQRQAHPVILGAGRLGTQKGFDILLQAFATMTGGRPARLIILGEGNHRRDLEDLARELKVADRVLMPGFRSDFYAWLARADLFALSSRWEGSPNVLTEALALGIPSVSTDCPSGPREILDNGRYGPLVPVDDADQLSRAMEHTLETPPRADQLKNAVAEYTAETSAERYLHALGVAPTGNRHAAV